MWANRYEFHPGFYGERESGVRAVVGTVAFVAIAWLVGILGSLSTIGNVTGWYAQADKAPWTPANDVFGPVWLALYTIMAVAAWLARDSTSRWSASPKGWTRPWSSRALIS